MLKRMLNCPERITYHRLREVCARRSAQVYAKVRLADVLPVEGSGLSRRLYEFALQAHYDFVITDLAQKPLFAVEFDGPGHGNPIQVERDARKDELSRRFKLPLLRVLADDLRRSEWRLDRLTEVTERWFDGNDLETGEHRSVGAGQPAQPATSEVAGRPLCPLCGSGMVMKNGKYGPFLSCARFPDCRGSCDLPKISTRVRSQTGGVHEPSANSIPHQWLIAAIVLIGLTLLSLVMIIALSRTVETRAEGPQRFADESIRNGSPVAPDRESGRRSDVPESQDDFAGRPGTWADKPAPVAPHADAATARQMNLLGLLIRRHGWDAADRNAEMERVLEYHRDYTELSKQEASKLITAWDDRGY